jgi:hypothetical protein
MRLLLSRFFLFTAVIAGLVCLPVSAQTLNDLHNFTSQPDGGYPGGNVVADKNGNLYGTSEEGGSGCAPIGCGTIWELSPPATAGGPSTETILYNFQGTSSDGSSPWGGLTMDTKGNLWGTTQFGGGSRCLTGCGTIFQLKRPTSGGSWTHHLAHSFAGGTHDGQQPLGGVVFDSAGNLYGTALGGGSHTSCPGGSCGIVFKMTPSGGSSYRYSVIWNFGGNGDGGAPESTPIVDTAGNLYGTTVGGGSGTNAQGTVWELSPSGSSYTESVLYSFVNTGNTGYYPEGSLVLDARGNLYGTNLFGGSFRNCSNGCGTIFRLKPPTSGGLWTLNTLYTFTGEGDGLNPYYGLLLNRSTGTFYGTTPFSFGSTDDCGVAFSLQKPTVSGASWTFAVLHTFVNTDGCRPTSGLTFGSGGSVYGTTNIGGSGTVGTVFQLTP